MLRFTAVLTILVLMYFGPTASSQPSGSTVTIPESCYSSHLRSKLFPISEGGSLKVYICTKNKKGQKSFLSRITTAGEEIPVFLNGENIVSHEANGVFSNLEVNFEQAENEIVIDLIPSDAKALGKSKQKFVLVGNSAKLKSEPVKKK